MPNLPAKRHPDGTGHPDIEVAGILEEVSDYDAKLLKDWLLQYAGRAQATQEALKKDLKHFARYCSQHNQIAAYASETTLIGYIESMHHLAPSTIQRRARTVARMLVAIDPRNQTLLQNVVPREISRAIHQMDDAAARQAEPIRWDTLARAEKSVDMDDLLQLRNFAMARLAYDSLLRRSELTGALVRHLTPIDGKHLGNGHAVLKIPSSKTDRRKKGAETFCRESTARIIARWIAAAELQRDDFLFVSFQGRTRMLQRGRRMRAASVNDIFRWVASKGGANSKGITGHSCRIGAAQDLQAAGASIGQIAQAGRWKSDTMVLRYTSGLRLLEGAMASLSEHQQ